MYLQKLKSVVKPFTDFQVRIDLTQVSAGRLEQLKHKVDSQWGL